MRQERHVEDDVGGGEGPSPRNRVFSTATKPGWRADFFDGAEHLTLDAAQGEGSPKGRSQCEKTQIQFFVRMKKAWRGWIALVRATQQHGYERVRQLLLLARHKPCALLTEEARPRSAGTPPTAQHAAACTAPLIQPFAGYGARSRSPLVYLCDSLCLGDPEGATQVTLRWPAAQFPLALSYRRTLGGLGGGRGGSSVEETRRTPSPSLIGGSAKFRHGAAPNPDDRG